MEGKLRMTRYADKEFEENLIYPDRHNEDDKGYRASYFYLHGEIERKADYDCFNCSPELLRKLLQNNIYLATVIIGEDKHKCIVFTQFSSDYNRMKGYVVKIDSIDDIKDAIRIFPYAFKPCGGYTPDDYLEKNYPESYKLIYDNYVKRGFVGPS